MTDNQQPSIYWATIDCCGAVSDWAQASPGLLDEAARLLGVRIDMSDGDGGFYIELSEKDEDELEEEGYLERHAGKFTLYVER